MANSIGVLTPDQMRLVWQTVQELRQSGLLAKKRGRPVQEPSGVHRVFIQNMSGATIPPFGCVQVTGTSELEGRTVVTVEAPTDICGEYLFNSEFAVNPGEAGWAYAHGQVRMLGTFDSYESCKRYAPTVGGFSVEQGPGPFLVYGADNTFSGALRGRIIGDHCQARWIVFRYKPEEKDDPVTPTDFWDGPDPSECGDVEVEYPIGEPLCECDVVAVYDPNTKKYKAIATESAMMGEPQTRTLVEAVAGYDCGVIVSELEYKTFPNSCNPSPTPVETPLGVETPVVVSISSESCGTINYAYQTIRAFVCDNPVEFIDFPINFDGVEFVTAASFGPPTCTGEATYTWNPTTNVWDLTTPCTNGCVSEPPPVVTPFPTSVYTETVPCDSPINGQCGLNLQMGTICQDDSSGAPLPTIVHVPLPLEPLVVSGEIYDNGTDAIVIERWKIYVCNFEAQPDDEIAIGICDTSSSGGSGP